MNQELPLSETALRSLEILESIAEGIARENLLETALALTASLHQKIADGGRITVTFPDGRVEELRFKVKRPGKGKK